MNRNKATALTRRDFLRTAVARGSVFACSLLIHRTAGFQTAVPPPSKRINMLFVGVGFRGMELLRLFLRLPECRVLAVCDVDQEHAETAKDFVNRHYGTRDCRVYYDFREPLARPDLDAAVLALPLHWHSIPAVTALKAGLDVYAEPPLAHTVREGRAICSAAARYARIWQTGNWRRKDPRFIWVLDLIRNGHIGAVRSVEIGLPESYVDCAGTAGQETPTAPPPGLDYNMWLGPAPWAPYAPARVHGNWRWNTDYGGGQLMEWIGQYMDIVQSSLGLEKTSPTEVEGSGQRPKKGLWNAPTKFQIRAVYSPNLTITIAAGDPQIPLGITWKGEQGTIHVGPEKTSIYPPVPQQPHGASGQSLPPPLAHCAEFIECVKSRRSTTAPAEPAQRAATVGHLGQIAVLLGRPIRWNPVSEEIIGDETAARLLGKTMREPWYI